MKKLKRMTAAMLLLWGCASQATQKEVYVPRHASPGKMVQPEGRLSELLPQGYDKSRISLLVEKSAYRLTVYYDNAPIKSYPVVLGPDPVSGKNIRV